MVLLLLDRFPGPKTAILFSSVVILLFAIEAAILRNRGTGQRKDRGSLYVVLVAIVVSVGASIGLSYWGLGLLPPVVSYAGMLLFLLGFWLRRTATCWN